MRILIGKTKFTKRKVYLNDDGKIEWDDEGGVTFAVWSCVEACTIWGKDINSIAVVFEDIIYDKN